MALLGRVMGERPGFRLHLATVLFLIELAGLRLAMARAGDRYRVAGAQRLHP